MNDIVIIGATHHNTYGVIRCFCGSGIKPDLIIIGDSNSFLRQSKLIGRFHQCKDVSDVLSLLVDNYEKAILITCSDDVTALLNSNYESYCKRFVFFNCGKNETLNYFMDKVVQVDLAKEIGFAVPISIKGQKETLNNAKIPYPCILKPLESIHGGKNIQICNNNHELQDSITRFGNNDILIQQFIEKDYEIVVVGLADTESIKIPAYIQKYRETKGGTTYSTVKRIEGMPNRILLLCKEYVKRMNYVGLFGIEFIVKDDDYYFIEINLRNDATTYSIAVAGVNLPLLYYTNNTTGNFSYSQIRDIEEIDSIVEFSDFINVLKRRVGLITWIKQLKRSRCRYCYCHEDSCVFWIQLKEFVKFIIKRLF